MAAAPIAFSVHLEMGDLFRALFFWNFKKFWFLTMVAPVCLLLTIAQGTGPEDNFPLGSLILAIIWGSLTFGIPYLGARTARTAGDIHYTFSESGIDLVAKHASGHMDWTLVTRAVETGSCILLIV